MKHYIRDILIIVVLVMTMLTIVLNYPPPKPPVPAPDHAPKEQKSGAIIPDYRAADIA